MGWDNLNEQERATVDAEGDGMRRDVQGVGSLSLGPTIQSGDAERAAAIAEGGDVEAAVMGKDVATEPSHRLTDLPQGEIWRVVNGIPSPDATTAINNVTKGFGALPIPGEKE
jgi:hypothetical protein